MIDKKRNPENCQFDWSIWCDHALDDNQDISIHFVPFTAYATFFREESETAPEIIVSGVDQEFPGDAGTTNPSPRTNPFLPSSQLSTHKTQSIIPSTTTTTLSSDDNDDILRTIKINTPGKISHQIRKKS